MKNTSITLGVDTANQLRRFKLRCKAKNIEQVIKLLIRTYRDYYRGVKIVLDGWK